MVEMTRPLDQSLLETVTALVDGLKHADVSYCLIGALVPELLLKTPRRSQRLGEGGSRRHDCQPLPSNMLNRRSTSPRVERIRSKGSGSDRYMSRIAW